MSQEIAWVEGIDIFPRRSYTQAFHEQGITVRWYEHAINFVEASKQKQWPLIISDIELAPGKGAELQPEVAEIMRFPYAGYNPNYSEIALWMIRQLRVQSSVNQKTPIIVASVVAPEDDGLYPHARRRLLEAGATEYLCLFDTDHRTKNFVEHVCTSYLPLAKK